MGPHIPGYVETCSKEKRGTNIAGQHGSVTPGRAASQVLVGGTHRLVKGTMSQNFTNVYFLFRHTGEHTLINWNLRTGRTHLAYLFVKAFVHQINSFVCVKLTCPQPRFLGFQNAALLV